MATTKKTTAGKTTARAKAPVKKAPAKTAVKAPAKKQSVKKSVSSNQEYKSFRLAKDGSLMTFKVTRQTVYWVIIMSFVIFFQLWIIRLQIDVAHLVQQQKDQAQEQIQSF